MVNGDTAILRRKIFEIPDDREQKIKPFTSLTPFGE